MSLLRFLRPFLLFNYENNNQYNYGEKITSDYGEDGCTDLYEDGAGGCLDEENPDYDEIENPDPNEDNYDFSENSLGTELNGIWNLGEGLEANNNYDEGEQFYDLGNNALPDQFEEYPEDDNWNDCGDHRFTDDV